MADPVADPPADPQRLALAWRIAPMSINFILDIRTVSRRDRDLIDSLLFATIISSNVAPLNRDTSLQLAYADLESPAPPEVRRPVSINAVAQSLRIPFETARRRIRRMENDGALEITPRGVVVPHTVIMQPDFIDGVVQRHACVGRFYEALRPTGALEGVTIAPPASPEPPVRITNRMSWDYVLRMADEMITMVGEPLSGLILLEILRLNIEELDGRALAAWVRDPVAAARPARTSVFSARLGLSPETARRYLLGLEDSGFCSRSPRGAVAVLPPQHYPALERIALDNLSNVQRMFARMGQIGALSGWEPATADAASA